MFYVPILSFVNSLLAANDIGLTESQITLSSSACFPNVLINTTAVTLQMTFPVFPFLIPTWYYLFPPPGQQTYEF